MECWELSAEGGAEGGAGGGGLVHKLVDFSPLELVILQQAAATYSPVFVVGSCASHDLYDAQKRDVGSQYRLRVRNHSHCHFRGGDTGKAPLREPLLMHLPS